jgi:hypothetical protein
MYITYRPYSEEDFEDALGVELRPADKVELLGKGFMDTPSAIYESLQVSHLKYVIETCTDGVVGVCGVTDLGGGLGCPWMLAGAEIEDHQYGFLKGSKELVGVWSDMFPQLVQEVWEGHHVALKWLAWLGFLRTGNEVCHDGMINYIEIIKETKYDV